MLSYFVMLVHKKIHLNVLLIYSFKCFTHLFISHLSDDQNQYVIEF